MISGREESKRRPIKSGFFPAEIPTINWLGLAHSTLKDKNDTTQPVHHCYGYQSDYPYYRCL
jgi:hypothetical protein